MYILKIYVQLEIYSFVLSVAMYWDFMCVYRISDIIL